MSNLQDLRARAEAFSDEPENYWQPKPGDVLAGEVVSIERRASEHDPNVPVVLLDTGEDELVSVWCFWTVLRSEFVKLRPQPGDAIVVKRLADSDRGYRRYRVFSDRQPAEFSWGSVDPDAGDMDPVDRQRMETEALLGSSTEGMPPISESDDPFDF